MHTKMQEGSRTTEDGKRRGKSVLVNYLQMTLLRTTSWMDTGTVSTIS